MIKTIRSRFDYAECWAHLSLKGRERYGNDFQLREEDAPIIVQLICWALKDEQVAKKAGIDFRKGIFLNGPIGAGKTCLMSLLNHFATADQVHAVRSCRDISYEFSVDGFEVIARYSKKYFRANTYDPKSICFDDLGLETRMMHFGNPCQVMGEILLSRYDMFVSYGMITHVTTNQNSQDIEDIYGKRVRSRMRQMFNLITFPNGTPDKRK